MSTREVSVRAADEDDPSGNGHAQLGPRPTPAALRDARREARQRRVAEPPQPPPAPVAPAPARPAARPTSADEVVVRQARGVVRQVDLWSVFRCSALLYGSLLVVALVAFGMLWVAATATGARHSVEHFIASALLLKSFHFASATILLSTAGIGLVLVAMATGATVMLAAFYNLISEVVGGFEVTVLQEEPSDPVV